MIAAGYITLGIVLTIVAEVLACLLCAGRLDTIDHGPDDATEPMPDLDQLEASQARHPAGRTAVIRARRAIPISVLDGTGRVGLAVTGTGGSVIVQFEDAEQALACASKLADRAWAALPDAPVTELFDGLAAHAIGHVVRGVDFGHARDTTRGIS